jgi:murein DD-endopeptidase MepM/ murein hydrolase activator NlpD
VPRVTARTLTAAVVAAACSAITAYAGTPRPAQPHPSASTLSPAAVDRALAVTRATPERAGRGDVRKPLESAFPVTPTSASPPPQPTSPALLGGPVTASTPEQAIRASTELAELANAQAPAPGSAVKPASAVTARWVRPNAGPLGSPFGRRWGSMHSGIDLAGSYGSAILAASAGVVLYAGPEQGYGRLVRIQEPDGTQTWYGHMSKYLVKAGDHVQAGQLIARVGAAGDATGPHLHFEVHVGGRAVDPVPFLREHGVRI